MASNTFLILKCNDNLYLGHRYSFDVNKFTLYDFNTKEAMHNEYASEVSVLNTRTVMLRHCGGKNPRKREFLGKINFYYDRDGNWLKYPKKLQELIHSESTITTNVDEYSYIAGNGIRYYTNKAQQSVIIVKSIEDWEIMQRLYPLQYIDKDRSMPTETINAIKHMNDAKCRWHRKLNAMFR